MTKRHLTRRQSWRIQKVQDERAKRADKRSSAAEQQLQEGDLGPEQKGLIISHFGSQIDVEAVDSENTGEITRCHIRSNIEQLVTGDQVVWRKGNPTGVVVALLPRQSILQRPDNYNRIRPVAANIDQIILVIAPQPEPHPNLIDRYLVAAEVSEIKPIILLNKIDTLTDEFNSSIDAIESLYASIGYTMLRASTKTSHGLTELTEQLKNHTNVFVGQSGVGKSSLINALLPNLDIKVGELSESTGQGIHTTTTARLYHFPAGGDLIDSPGIREFGLWHIEKRDLLDGFVEFRPHIGLCKFRDCNHESEPGCRLLKAVEDGEVSEQRMDSYRHILNSFQEGR